MGTKQAFKTYTRTTRIQDTNISFAKGMSYTSAPLSEGFFRLLVNYDFGNEDTTIIPRKGFITSGIGLIDYSGLALPFSEDMVVLAGNKVTHNNVEYQQIIVGRVTDSTDQDLYIGDAWVLTSDGKTLKYAALNDDFLGLYKCYFRKPNLTEASIHGIALEESQYSLKHIGVFAFNGDYYYFTSDGKLRHTAFNGVKSQYEPEVVTPFEITQAEAQNSLYNMLLTDPYNFKCNAIGSTLSLTGFMPIDRIKQELVLYPKTAILYDYKLYYNYPAADPTHYYFHIEYTNGSDGIWYTLYQVDETEEFAPSDQPKVFHNLDFTQNDYIQLRIYAVNNASAEWDKNGRLTLEALSNAVVLTTAIKFSAERSVDGTTNLGLKRYDLSKARGMAYWKNRLFVFGAFDRESNKTDSTILIASDPNRPDWFPYAANADIFDEEIISIQPMLDNLLVFTAHNLYSLTLSSDGLAWTKEHLQSNLNIKPWDLNLIQIVKNMVFFKSGNYYYMVVPKLTATSGTGLSIAPITKPIEDLVDNFLPNVKQIIDDLYNFSLYTRYRDRAQTTFDIQLVHYYNHLDYEDVHNTYVFKVVKRTKTGYNSSTNEYTYEDSKPLLLNFTLLYNTVNRTWRIYIIESEQVLHPLFVNATGKGTYVTLVNYEGRACIQLLEYIDTLNYDAYIRQGNNTIERASIFKNWQYFDSGNMDQNSDMKKRFREYQFKINDRSSSVLEFYSGFFIDKLTRTYEMLYNEEEIPDTEDENVSTIVIDAIPMHANSESQDKALWTTLGSWRLGISQFPNVNIYKIRIPTSGKGYLPRTILISYNEKDYEVLSYATVYRQLYSR